MNGVYRRSVGSKLMGMFNFLGLDELWTIKTWSYKEKKKKKKNIMCFLVGSFFFSPSLHANR